MKQVKQPIVSVLYEEITKGCSVNEDDANYWIKEQRLITFLNIPRELEKVLYLGYLICLDSFLFLFTFLPIRTVFSLCNIANSLLQRVLFFKYVPIDKGLLCDLFRMTMLVVVMFCLSHVNISMVYHIIRGQSVIKLYFIYNCLEILDYLCLSFGNDVFEALFWLTIRVKKKKRENLPMVGHWALGCTYTLIHSISFLCQAICLSVAINSHNKSLLVVMVTNQYMELKSYLFKKFDKDNNYQIVARDIRERFQYTIVLILVFIRNLSQLDWDTSHVYVMLPDVGLIIASEIAIDWIKHAFVTKFNGISIESYKDYCYQLYDDLLNPEFYNHTFSNRMDLMARKILFIPMPLACLSITVLIEVIPDDLQYTWVEIAKYGTVTVFVMFIMKLINMGLIIRSAEQLKSERPIYTTPKVPPIRGVNSSVKLPKYIPVSPIDDPEPHPIIPEVKEPFSLSTDSEIATTLSSVSLPQFTAEFSNRPADHVDFASTHPPESSVDVNSKPDDFTPSDDLENKPPVNDNALLTNLNNNVNLTDLDGLRKRMSQITQDC